MYKNQDNQPILTISILISNNYDNVKRCLESVKPLLKAVPSELILTDTGVEPELRKLLEQYTDNIIDFTWCRDFSAARNVGLKQAKGQWFLYIDDDEWFEDITAIAEFLQSREALNYNVACYIQRNYEDREGKKYIDHVVDRILRINPKLHFEHRVHEAYTDIRIKEKKQLPVIAHHYGYCYDSEEQRREKYLRNKTLLELECKEHPQDMRMRYQLVINPYSIRDWDASIALADKAIETESDSEYWDACHTSILYCLEKKGDWETLIQRGKDFLQKPIGPFDRFGIMQFMIDAYWNTKHLEELCDMAENALELYQEYSKNPLIFNRNQLMRTTFVEKEYMLYFLMYSITAGLSVQRDSLIQKLTTGATSEFVDEILNTKELAEWINENITDTEEKSVPAENTVHRSKTIDRLVFDPSFFEREERNGFVIEPMMKNAWAANLYVLHVIDRICEENQIPYFADWGTLLGAVRHRGYIPWDDDIDICMLRKDYLRFCEVIEQYKDEVALLNNYTADDWGAHADKVVNIAAFTVKRSEIKKYYGFPFTAGVDIFLIDYVPREKALEEEQLEVLRTISLLIHLREEMGKQSPTSKEYAKSVKAEKILIEKIQKMTNVVFSQPNPTDQEVLILGEEVSGLYGDEDSDYLSQLQRLGAGLEYYIPKEVYGTSIRLPFENTTIPVPVGYDMLLRKKYGDDYMTPRNVATGHDYPFYNKAISEVASLKNQTEEEVKGYVSKMATEFYADFLHKSALPRIVRGETDFQSETIGDTEVLEETKRKWAAQVEVYLEVKRLAQKHEIKLYAIGDTLKGAVTRKNFLPKSEEMQFAMSRPDYMKFLVILQEELDPWFDYRNVYAYEEWEDMRCYVCSDGYLCDEQEYQQRFHGCKESVGIYISAMDRISENKSKEDTREMLVENLLSTAEGMPSQPPYSDDVIKIVREWRQLAQVNIDMNNNLRREFVKAADCIAGGYRGECSRLRIFPELHQGRTNNYDKEWFRDTIEMDFAGTTVFVPVGYKNIFEGDENVTL
ncbi:MAG: LicD family protein [Lachnospiraceae bacterium]|nr:LicD family protein [Lachnospiraceae bacterium]